MGGGHSSGHCHRQLHQLGAREVGAIRRAFPAGDSSGAGGSLTGEGREDWELRVRAEGGGGGEGRATAKPEAGAGGASEEAGAGGASEEAGAGKQTFLRLIRVISIQRQLPVWIQKVSSNPIEG